MKEHGSQYIAGKFHILVPDPKGLCFPSLNLAERQAIPIDVDLPDETPANWCERLAEHIQRYKNSTDIFHQVEMFHLSGIAEIVHEKAAVALNISGNKQPPPDVIIMLSAELDKTARKLALQKFRGKASLLAIESEEPLSPTFVKAIERKDDTHKTLDVELAQYKVPAKEARAIKQAYRTLSDMAISYFSLLIGEDYANNKFFTGRYDVYLALMTYVDMALQFNPGESKRLQKNGWTPLARIIHALENTENYPDEDLLSGDVAEILSTFSQLLTTIEDRYYARMLDNNLQDPVNKSWAKKTFPDDLPLQKLNYAKSFFLHSVSPTNQLAEPKILPMMEHYGHGKIAAFLKHLFETDSISVECSAKSALRARLETGVSIREQMLIRGIDPNAFRPSEWTHELIKWIIINQPETVLDPELYFSLPETIRGRMYVRGSQFNHLIELYSKNNVEDEKIPYRRGPSMPPVHLLTAHRDKPTQINGVGIHHPYKGNAAQAIIQALTHGGFGMFRAIYDAANLHLYGVSNGYGHIEIQFFPHAQLVPLFNGQSTSIQRLVHAQRQQYIARRNTTKY